MEQSRDLTNRNRIRGILGWTSGQRIAKSGSIKGQGCRSGGSAAKAIELTWGDLRHRSIVPLMELGKSRGDPTVAQESAEGIVGRAVGEASEALQAERRSNR
jgi:hypothetical protein